MAYIHRSLERKFLKMSSAFKAVMVTGARQVGKSTMLKYLAQDTGRTYVSLDDADIRELAESDSKLFFQMYQPPILIDEAQKAPTLFEQIKILCDESDERGRFWLTGSQSRKLMKQAGDSLAGRIGILKLFSLSAKELEGRPNDIPENYTLSSLLVRSRNYPENNIQDVYTRIWEGGMPDMISMDAELRREYWNSYIESYLMRDAVDDNGIQDTEGFRKLLRACAAFTGELINYNDLGNAAGVSGATAKEWVKILQTMGIIFLLEPYFNNELKRMIKTPKLYFCDTGLCAYLSRWLTVDTLQSGAANGHYFENYVVMELVKNYAYAPQQALISFYRDDKAKEIDVFVEENGKIHPLEIKMSANPDKKETRKFDVIEKTTLSRGKGGIVCMVQHPFPLNADDLLIPSNLI